MHATFWVIQLALLLPVLFMAATAGAKGPGSSSRRRLNAAVSGLSQFTAEQQARLLRLRAFVQDARVRGGPLADDLTPAREPTAAVSSSSHALPSAMACPPGHALPSGSTRPAQLLVALASVLVISGGVGVMRTNAAMDALVQSSVHSNQHLTPAQRFLPGVLEDPARYVSAVNAALSEVPGVSWTDPLQALALVDQKVAMDRWEAVAGLGVSLALFASAWCVARRTTTTEAPMGRPIAFDLAPLVMVASFMFAALSFCELP